MNRREFLLAGASASALLAMSPAAIARRLGGAFTILVTADTEAHVAAVQGRVEVPLPADRAPTDWERNVAGL